MRGLVESLVAAHPLGDAMPAALQEDDFCRRFTQAIDDVVAPVQSTLDCLFAYLDPRLAPSDFVDWLADWVGLELDETWPEDRRRRLVEEAISLYQRRGTVGGMARHIELYAGVEPEIEDTGGCWWSQSASTALPGSPTPQLTVRVVVADASAVSISVLQRIVAGSRPAHVPYTVELTTQAPARRPGQSASRSLGTASETAPEAASDAAPETAPTDTPAVVGADDSPTLADAEHPEAPDAPGHDGGGET